MLKGIPTPQDQNMLLQASVTQNAASNSAGFDMGAGFTPGGLGMPAAAVVDVSAMNLATGDETYTFKLQESDDNATWTDAGAAASFAATGVGVAKGFITKRYVRLVLAVAGTGPSITYQAFLNPLMQR